MKFKFLTAHECPHPMDELARLKEEKEMLCCVINNPDNESDRLVTCLTKALGNISDDYYQSQIQIRLQELGAKTNKVSIIVPSPFLPYKENISDGHFVGFFSIKVLKK